MTAPGRVKGGEAAQGTSGVVEAVKAGDGTIGYADESQAGDLGIASVKVGDTYVAPSSEAAAKILDQSQEGPGRSARASTCFAYDLNRTTTDPGTLSGVLVSYLIGCTKYDSADQGELVKALLQLHRQPRGPGARPQNAGSAPMPPNRETQDPARGRRDRQLTSRLSRTESGQGAGLLRLDPNSGSPRDTTTRPASSSPRPPAGAAGGRQDLLQRRGDRRGDRPRAARRRRDLPRSSSRCPRSPPSASELPDGKTLVDYIAPLAFGTVLAAAARGRHRGPARGRRGPLHQPHRPAPARAPARATSSICWPRSRASSTGSGASSSSARRWCRCMTGSTRQPQLHPVLRRARPPSRAARCSSPGSCSR